MSYTRVSAGRYRDSNSGKVINSARAPSMPPQAQRQAPPPPRPMNLPPAQGRPLSPPQMPMQQPQQLQRQSSAMLNNPTAMENYSPQMRFNPSIQPPGMPQPQSMPMPMGGMGAGPGEFNQMGGMQNPDPGFNLQNYGMLQQQGMPTMPQFPKLQPGQMPSAQNVFSQLQSGNVKGF